MLKNPRALTAMARSIGFAIALLIPVALGNGAITWMHVFSVLSISVVSVFLGRQLAYRLSVSESASFSATFEIVMGFSVLSLLQLILTLIFKLSPTQAFSTAVLLIGGLSLINLKLLPAEKNDPLEFNIKFLAFDVGVLIFISLLTTLWCRELIVSVPEAKAIGVFHAWPDIFLHANQIASLQNYSVLSNQSPYLAGTEQSLYHVASYAISSFYASMNNELTLSVATYFWVPVGIILMGVSVYGLGCALAGRLTGFLATAAIFLLPDASMYGLKNGFFGFYWLLQASPGSGYAMALVLIALAVFIRGVQEGRFGLILWSVPIGLFSAAFRVQIAAPAAIMFTILAMISWKSAERWHRKAVFYGLLAVAASVIILSESIELAPHFLSGKYKISLFFDAVHMMATTSYGGLYSHLTDHLPVLWKWTIGYGLLLIAALGLIFPIALVWIIKKLSVREEWQISIIPLVLLLSCFMIIVCLPVPADGDFTNFGHRLFVLLYAVFLTILIAWTRVAYAQMATRYGLSKHVGFAVVFLLILGGVTVPWVYGKNIQQPDLRPDWAHNITITPILSDLFKAASYIQQHSSLQDKVLSSNLDPLALVVTLTERQAFLSREALYRALKGESGRVFALRKTEFERLKNISNYEELRAFGTKNNIQWFLKYPRDMPGWSQNLLNCSVYESGGIRIYDLRMGKCF